jgi:alkanesulfonate monooxygenase SsuD/methylene tetrahydromethanopterin reductase-like flavin-dependent oxidoreductase (luciferase family)
MGFRPFQLPHPPIEMAAQSEPATRRAARIANGVLFGPQDSWADVARLAGVYRAERQAQGADDMGFLGASRSLIVGTSKEDAAARAAAYLERTFAMYRTWAMQEPGMVPLQLDSSIGLDDWTVNGSPADCVETLLRAEREIGLNAIGFTIYSLPRSPEERIEYLQMIAEEIVAKVA